jgi:hypothetical protein
VEYPRLAVVLSATARDDFDAKLTAFALDEPPDWSGCGFYKEGSVVNMLKLARTHSRHDFVVSMPTRIRISCPGAQD